MSDQQNWKPVSEEFMKTVQDALNTGDFKELNKRISESVPGALQEAKRQGWKAVESFYTSANQQTKVWYTQKGGRVRRSGDRGSHTDTPYQNAADASYYTPVVRVSRPPAALYTKKGRVSGWFARSIGGLLALSGAITTVTAIWGLSVPFTLGALKAALTFETIPMFLLGGFLFFLGHRKGDLLRNADRYLKALNGKTYMNIEDIGLHAGQAPEMVLKKIRAMISGGIFPQGHLDQNGKCFMLDDRTFRQYVEVEKRRRLAETGERVNPSETAGKENFPEGAGGRETGGGNADGWSDLQTQGRRYIEELRALNEDIPGESISAMLDRLETLLEEIFERIRKKQEEVGQMSRFMEYYLPTTLKLVQKYRDFEGISAPGQDVIRAMREIEKALEAINGAFAEFRDNMLRAEAFDVSTDAQVLQTMLARSGLGQGGMEMTYREREKVSDNG